MTDASKLFILTKKFWKGRPDYPRVVISDTKAPQLYTFEYGNPDKAMVLITYAWEDRSTQLATITSKEQLRAVLASQIDVIMREAGYPEYAGHLTNPADNSYAIHWQQDTNSYGAFTLAQPGQIHNIAAAFYDYQRVDTNDYNGFSLIGDSIYFAGGWTEAALQTSLNVVSALLKRYGTLNALELAPVNLIDASAYRYTTPN